MKILYTIDQVYKHGGIEKALSQKANYLADVDGDEVYVLTHNQGEKPAVYPFSDKIQFLDLGINYVEGRSYFHPKNLLKARKHKAALKRALKQIQPDIVISCSFGPNFYFLPEVEKQIPKVKEFHGSRYFSSKQPPNFKQKLQVAKRLKAESQYDAIIVLNEDEKPYYNSSKITVIPNPTEWVEYSSDLTSKKVLAAGRISPVKNFGELIEIWKTVAEDFPDWELHIFGEDYLNTQVQLEKMRNELGLENAVKFKGTSTDMEKTMRDYSIYAMTSKTECFPMILLESLSMGIPILTYNSPTGPKYIVTDGEDAFLVPYKNKEIFIDKLKELMRDDNLRIQMGKKGRQNAKRFEISVVMKQWKDLFLSLTHSQTNK